MRHRGERRPRDADRGGGDAAVHPHGYNGVSYLDIARELGTTHSNVHYYFRTKAKLAETVLRSVSGFDTQRSPRGIWTDPATDLLAKFIKMRDWIHSRYFDV